MAVATKQSLKAAQLKELEEEQRRFEEQAAKKKAAEEAAAKKAAAENKKADLPGYRPQETISKDEMYSMLGIQTKSNLGTSKQAVGDTIAKAAGAQGGIDKIENAKTRKAAEQARKYKEADLVGAKNSDYQKRLEQEKTEYLNIKEARDKKYALEQELLKAKTGAKEQSMNAGTAAVVASGRKGGNSVIDPETRERISGLEKEISDLGRDINLAERAQNKKHLYNSALKAGDFEKYSFEPEEETKPETIKPNRQNIERETETVKRFMTEDEKAVYNYYLNKFGKEKAEEFFDSIREELNQRQAKAIFEGNEGKAINEYIQGAVAGLENAKEGFKGAAKMVLGEDEAQPTGTYDFLSEMAREDLGKSGIKLPEALGGASLGQIGFDVINTTANMLPSLVLGTLGGGAVGAAAIGTSAAGNAYNEAVGAGYDKEQAANYSVLVGASEAALGYLLGGIEATGGKLGKAAITKLLGKIDNALLRTAVNVGEKMTSEFTEEYLQSVLEPVFGNLALLQENEINLLSSEAIYSGILGALSAGGIAVLGGSGTAAEIPPAFDGNIVTEEQRIIADKIAEIENSPISEAEKAAKMQEIANAVAETTKTPEVMAEAERFRNIHEQNAGEPISFETDENVFGLKRYSEKQVENWAESKRIVICDTFEKIKNFVNEAISNKNNKKAYFGAITSDIAQRIIKETGINIENYNCSLGSNEIRKIFKDHGDEKIESLRGQRAVTINDVFEIPNIIKNADTVNRSETDYEGKPVIEFRKNIDGSIVTVIGVVSDKHLDLFVQTEYAGIKKGNLVTPTDVQAPVFTPEAPRDTVSSNIIYPVSEISNPESIENSLEAESRAEEQTKTPSMERAAPNLDVQYWTGIAEGIDMESGIWRMKDFARVLDGAAGGNKELRQRLYDLYEKPLNEAQGTYAKNYADKIESITKKFKELGIKAGSKESAAVQRIGEGVKEIDKNGNTTEYTLDDLKKEFPDSWKSIKAGADYCREIYDEFLNDLNAMYSEIYPATVEKANEQVSEYNARISLTADHIASYENVILELEKSKREKRQQLFKKKPDSLIYAELENQIANIDRKINIATRRIEILKNRKLTKEISRDTLLAQIENGEILKNKQIKPRKDYFRHFQELTDEFAEIADIFSNDQRIPPNLAGKSADTKPRTIWTSIAQSRGKNYYTEDAVSGLLRYTEIAEKLLVYDPLISHFRDVNSAIRAAGVMVDNEVKGKGTNAGQFAAWADDITNQLAGKTNKIDRIVSDNFGALGRSGIKAIEALNRRVKSNAILGNVRSALVQIGNLPNASLYIQNPKDWANGVISMLNDNVKNDPLIQEGRNRSKFMNRRYMGDTIDELTKEIQQNKILDKPKEFALWMLGAGDKLSAELIWHTAYTRALRNPDILSAESNKLRSYEDAVDYADDITRRSIGGRAEGDIPYFEESKITGLVAPFQIEVANTFNAFMEQGKKKNIAGLLAFEINVFLLSCVLEGITGDRPLGLDYIKVAWDIFNEATGDDKEEEEKEAWDIVTYGLGRILGETLSSMPFGTQIAGFLTGGDEQKAEKWFGDSDPTRYGTGNIGMGALADAVDYFVEGETPEEFYRLATEGGTVGEWAEPVLETVDTFAPLAMPWGGKQLSRSLRGIQQIAKGGAFGMDSEGNEYMKFPQGEDPESIVKTLLFGQYASDAGQRYIYSGFKDKLTAKQTEQMKEAAQFGISKDEFYETVLGLKPYKKEEEKQQALFENKILDSSEKSIVDWILFGDKNKPWELRDYSSKEAFYESGLEEKDRVLYDMGYSDAEIRKINAALKESQKKGESIENLADALDIEEKEAFEIYQKINKEWIEDESGLDEKEKARLLGAAKLYGMSTENYLTVLNYSKYGAQKNGDYSTAMEDVLPHIINATGWDEAKATEMYNRVVKYDYTEADIGEEQRKDLVTSGKWYAVEEKGYFIARNAIKTAEGEKDQYGNTVSGSKKAAAIEEIARQMKIDEEEATVYYLAANGDLVFSANDLTTAQRKDLEAAQKEGWTERQFFDAVNIIKVSGVSKKDEIIKALTNAGASYEMALGYYNLKQNNDYGKGFGG